MSTLSVIILPNRLAIGDISESPAPASKEDPPLSPSPHAPFPLSAGRASILAELLLRYELRQHGVSTTGPRRVLSRPAQAGMTIVSERHLRSCRYQPRVRLTQLRRSPACPNSRGCKRGALA